MGLKMRPRRRLNMRKALSIIAVAAIVGFGLQIMGGPTETIAAKEIASIPIQKIGVSGTARIDDQLSEGAGATALTA
jgi:hypothetical protein